jgi:hypothetical protein
VHPKLCIHESIIEDWASKKSIKPVGRIRRPAMKMTRKKRRMERKTKKEEEVEEVEVELRRRRWRCEEAGAEEAEDEARCIASANEDM